MKFSDPEKHLLQEIQRDASLPLSDLAQRVGMAQSTVWRKLQDFEKRGVIRGRVTLIDPAALGLRLTVLASITLSNHDEATISGFTRLVDNHPEIVECLATSGQADYRLKIRTLDVEAYERFMTHTLLRSPFVREVHSSFVLKELKSTTELPL